MSFFGDDYRSKIQERNLTREIERRVKRNSGLAVGSTVSQVGGTPPKVKGLALDTAPGSITAVWDDVPIGDLDRYELQASTSTAFVDPITRSTRAPSFPVTELTGGTTYYIRVRAVNSQGTSGPYSATLNAATGQITSDDIADGAVTTLKIDSGAVQEYVSFVKSSGFATLDTNTEAETYGPVEFTTTDADTIVIPRYVFDIDIHSDYLVANDTNRLTTELLRRPSGGMDSVISTSVVDLHFKVPSVSSGGASDTLRVTVPTFSDADVVGSAGTFEYRLRLTTTISGSAVLSITAANLTLEAFVIRR